MAILGILRSATDEHGYLKLCKIKNMNTFVRNAHKPAQECICVTVDEQNRADEQRYNVRPAGVRIQMNPISEQDTNMCTLKSFLKDVDTFSSLLGARSLVELACSTLVSCMRNAEENKSNKCIL